MQKESAKIFADYLAGDDEAANEIVERYTHRLVALARTRLSEKLRRRVDPEDIVQSAYRSFFRKADNNEIALKRNGDLWRLLAAMTINKAQGRIEYELAKKRTPRSEETGSSIINALEKEPTPEEAAILIEQLAAFLIGLTVRDRRTLELRLQGESIESIAMEVEVSEATIRRILRKAKEKLERRLLAE